MHKILITGAAGQLGSEVLERALEHGYQVMPFNHQHLDITDEAAVTEALHIYEPTHVIHCAAWTDVDGCERNQLKAERINSDGTRHIVRAAADVGAHVTYISTDYIFDGKKETPYEEYDSPSPISAYGLTKLQGETCIRPTDSVVRISSVCGKNGKNILKTILRIASESSEISFVDDQFSNPTFADDASLKILELATNNSSGIWHVTNQGSTSWYEFAKNVIDFAGIDVVVNPIKSITIRNERPALRPLNSILRNKRMEDEGIQLLDHHLIPMERLVKSLLS